MRFIIFIFSFLLIFSTARADEKLNQVLKELQQIKKDMQTLEKAVYSQSFKGSGKTQASGSLEGALTRQLVKITELEEQMQKLTASHEEVMFSFEQLGGAEACMDMAKEYAMGRYAFGRSIASFQAIKHKLADMFIAVELARSNCYYGAWALSTDAPELPTAAATCRVSASQAFHECSKENIQTHGGMGATWEFDCHLFYRRARLLSSNIGSQGIWKDKLITSLEKSNSPT